MNGKDIFVDLCYINEELIQQAESGTYRPGIKDRVKREPILIGANVVLILTLAILTAIYVLHFGI